MFLCGCGGGVRVLSRPILIHTYTYTHIIYVHKVGMPDAAGRQQIVAIHTAAMRKSGRVTPEAEARLGELVGCVPSLGSVCRCCLLTGFHFQPRTGRRV